MKKLTKLFLIIFTLAFALSSFSGCTTIYKITAPKEYKETSAQAIDYPEDALPVYEDSIIYDYEYDEENKTISLKYGNENDLDDIAEFYMDYFDENNVFLSTEKDRSKTYLADGELGNYEFELSIDEPTGKWEERLYSSITEITLKIVNIPNKSQVLSYLDDTQENIKAFLEIYDTYYKLEDSDEDDIDYYIKESESVLNTLSEIKSNLLENNIPNNPIITNLNKTELEIADILSSIFNDYKDISVYFNELDEVMEGSGDISNPDFETFSELISAYSDLTNRLDTMDVPSFIDGFHTSLINVIEDTVNSSEYIVDAIDNNDRVLIYAGLYSYNINIRDIVDLYDFYTSDTSSKADRMEEKITRTKDSCDGITDWITVATKDIYSDAEEISSIPKEHILHTDEIEIMHDYLFPETIIPANYRSLDYIAFVQLYTNKGETTAKLTVEIPGFTQKFEQKIEISQSETEIKVRPPLVTDAIKNLNSSKDAQLIITVEDLNSGELVVQDTMEITLYSRYDMQWYDEYNNSYLENILAWMTPEADEISTLLRAAADSAEYLSKGELDSIVGYQRVSDWSEAYITYVQVASIMHALAKDLDVKYIAEPFSATSTTLQRVKTPEQVINEKGGLCAETALTIASALQAMGMHPVLIFPPGHVVVAVETWYGSGEYLLIETTALTSAANEDFDNVIVFPDSEAWDEYLSQDDYFVVDCALADDYGIKSID